MQLTVTGANLEVTEALEHHARKKLEKLVTHLHSITSIDVILKIDNHKQIAEATVLFPHHTLFADAENGDMYNAIDLLTKKLMAQVDKHKEKMTNHHVEKDKE